MFHLRPALHTCLFAVVAAVGFAGPARGTAIITATEVGGDVVLTGSGTLDPTAWGSFLSSVAITSTVQPAFGFGTGPSGLADVYALPVAFSGPASFGPGTTPVDSTSGSGDLFGLSFASGSETLGVPVGYFGGPLSGSATYAGETFASLGMTVGTYEWTWDTGGSFEDSFILEVVPEPTTALLGIAGLMVFAATCRPRAVQARSARRVGGRERARRCTSP